MLGVFFCFVTLRKLSLIQVDTMSDEAHTRFETYMQNNFAGTYRSFYLDYSDLLFFSSKETTEKVLPYCNNGTPNDALTFIYIDLPEPSSSVSQNNNTETTG